MEPEVAAAPLWPFGIYALLTFLVVGGMLGLSYVLGQRTENRRNVLPYESGVSSTGSARVRLSADFYLFAVFFVIFDIESLFIYSWSLAVPELGWLIYVQMLIFIGSLVAALVYLWRDGALEARR